MKKVFTLLAATGLFMAANAQPGIRRAPVKISVVASVNHAPSFAADPRLRAEIARINNKYDRKIEQVRRSFFMRPAVKASKIRSLEQQRKRELDKLFYKNNRHHRNDYPNRRY